MNFKKMRQDNFAELKMFFPDHVSHVVRPQTDKKRRCLRCKDKFISISFSKRLCGRCGDINARVSKTAIYIQ